MFKEKSIFTEQTHSNNILHLTDKLPLKNTIQFGNSQNGFDAIITSLPQIITFIKTADCVPIFLVDIEKKVIANIHCGWLSIRSHILLKCLDLLQSIYSSSLENLLVFIGPSIQEKCYEVQKDFLNNFNQSTFFKKFLFKTFFKNQNNQYFFSLQKTIIFSLLEKGILEKNIFNSNICTKCSSLFYSHRENKTLQRNLNFLSIL